MRPGDAKKPAPGGDQGRARDADQRPTSSAHEPDAARGASGPRAQCLRLIEAAVGPGGMRAFLAARQPELDDQTGAWLLQNEPARLLRRLTMLAASADDWLDDVPEPAARRKESEVDRVLSILDELETGGDGA